MMAERRCPDVPVRLVAHHRATVDAAENTLAAFQAEA